jgi:mannitol-1-/sugar-/sorbitol-6-phosphatase
MAVLFDLDGVLIDSFALHRRVWEQWAVGHGLEPVDVFAATFGRRPADTIRDVAGHLVPEDELARLDALLDAEADAVTLQPGALRAVQAASRGRWAIVTSTEQRRARTYLDRLGCPTPEVVIGGTDVERGKPAFDGYLAAAERLGVAPSGCLVVEDAPAGIEAAKRAGASVVAVATTRSASELSEADLVVAELTAAVDLLRVWAQDPPDGLGHSDRLLAPFATRGYGPDRRPE